jgi:hypothetical protein
MTPQVASVALSSSHGFAKVTAQQISLLAGLGVEGDAHCGVTVKHRAGDAITVKLPAEPHRELERV